MHGSFYVLMILNWVQLVLFLFVDHLLYKAYQVQNSDVGNISDIVLILLGCNPIIKFRQLKNKMFVRFKKPCVSVWVLQTAREYSAAYFILILVISEITETHLKEITKLKGLVYVKVTLITWFRSLRSYLKWHMAGL